MIIASLGVLAALYFCAPSEHGFYPRCPLHSLTGLDCPGCGSLRATHALLHGEVGRAFQFNPLYVGLLLPLGAVVAAADLVRRRTGRDWLVAFRRPVWLWLLLAATMAFGVWRNVPRSRLQPSAVQIHFVPP